MGEVLGERAIVVGRSMAGLGMASALAPHFEQVVIVERDGEPAGPEPRAGVGQGRHAHNLLRGGLLAIEQLLPGTCAALSDAGALTIRVGLDDSFYDHGVVLPRRDLGVEVLSATRPLLEHVVMQRVLELPSVALRSGAAVDGLCFEGERVAGVVVRDAPEPLRADLVVDCSGRISKTHERLVEHGFEAPPSFQIHMGVSYTSALFEAPEDVAAGVKSFAVMPAPPNKRGSFVLRVEQGRWLVTLHTRFEKELPGSAEEMLAFARTIEMPETAEFLAQARAFTEPRSYRKPHATWRRYDKLARFPEGLLVAGDAVTSFNPVFGQGMSVAWQQAVALEGLLRARARGDGNHGGGLEGLAREFFAAAMPISREAWNGSTLIDAAYEEVTGDRRPGSDQGILFLRGLRTLLADDAALHRDYIGVGQMTTPSSVLLEGDRAERIMAAIAAL